MLSPRGALPNRCSVDLKKLQQITENSKILGKHLSTNSVLIKIQFLSMLLYFHRKTKINKVSSQVSFKLFVQLF